jgi:hypothetical protein
VNPSHSISFPPHDQWEFHSLVIDSLDFVSFLLKWDFVCAS